MTAAIKQSRTRDGVLPVEATVTRVTLTDNSVAYHVHLPVEGAEIIFAAMDRKHATDLLGAINECAWIERAA